MGIEFVSSGTAKNILRGHAREATKHVPDTRRVQSRVKQCASLIRPNPQTADLMVEYLDTVGINNGRVTVLVGYGATVVYGNVVRFKEDNRGWLLSFEQHVIRLFMGAVDKYSILPDAIHFYGHALERFYQRASEIRWPVVLDEIRKAHHFMAYWDATSGLQANMQVLLPTTGGYYIGYLELLNSTNFRGEKHCRIIIKTFLPDGSKRKFDSLKTKLIDLDLTAPPETKGVNSLTHIDAYARSRMRPIIDSESWVLEPYQELE